MMWGIIIILIILAIYFLSIDIRNIADDGWVLYYSPDCSYCVKQKKHIGWKMVFLPTVNCKENSCPEIKKYPTWYNTKTNQVYESSILDADIAGTLRMAGVREPQV